MAESGTTAPELCPRQPVRHEAVTHVLGTLCYLCLRAGHVGRWRSQQVSNLKPDRYEQLCPQPMRRPRRDDGIRPGREFWLASCQNNPYATIIEFGRVEVATPLILLGSRLSLGSASSIVLRCGIRLRITTENKSRKRTPGLRGWGSSKLFPLRLRERNQRRTRAS